MTTAKDRRIAALEREVSRLNALLAQARDNPYPVPLAAPEYLQPTFDVSRHSTRRTFVYLHDGLANGLVL